MFTLMSNSILGVRMSFSRQPVLWCMLMDMINGKVRCDNLYGVMSVELITVAMQLLPSRQLFGSFIVWLFRYIAVVNVYKRFFYFFVKKRL